MLPLLLRHSKSVTLTPSKFRLFTTLVQDLATLDAYKAAIANNAKAAIDFSAEWCPPCKIIGPIFAGLKAVNPNVKFFKLDVDKNAEAAKDAKIEAMPTFKFYHNGVRVDELVGASQVDLKAKLKTLNDS